MGNTLDSLWPGAADAANDFLAGNTASPQGFVKTDDGVWYAPGSTSTPCTSTLQCPTGYACVGQRCQRADGGGGSGAPGGQGSGPGGTPGQCPDGPNSPCNTGGPDSCQSAPTCGGKDDECCGQSKCCTFGSLSSFRPGVTCQCGECPEPPCTDFCDFYLKAFGEEGADCKDRGCDSCSECTGGYCEQLDSGAPCFCSGATACGDCEKCITDSEDFDFGDCEFLPYETNCKDCRTSTNYYCGCGKYLGSVTHCVPYGENPWPGLHAKAAKACEGACKPPRCKSRSNCVFYSGGGVGMPTCSEGETQKGVIYTSKGICVLCEECEPDTECECSTNSDCGHCEVCGSDCTCQPDDGCEKCEIDPVTGEITGKVKVIGALAEWSGTPKGSGGPDTSIGTCGQPNSDLVPYGMTLRFFGGVGVTANIQYFVKAGTQSTLTNFGAQIDQVQGCNTSKLPNGACFKGLPGGNTKYYISIGGSDPSPSVYLTYNPVNSANVSGTAAYSCTGFPTAAPKIIESRAFCSTDELPVADPDDYSVYADVITNSYGEW